MITADAIPILRKSATICFLISMITAMVLGCGGGGSRNSGANPQTDNQVPTAADDTVTTPFNTPIAIDVLVNDQDPDGSLQADTVGIVSKPANGAAEVKANGKVNYTPDLNFSGNDSFGYTVQDDQGAVSNEAIVSVSVSPNGIPTATVSAPAATTFNEGENITFSGSAEDDEDGQLSGDALVWTSSIDGRIGTGTPLITSALSPGDHEITLTATDSIGDDTTDTVSIHVEPTRFIKMGLQATEVTDASNAFDGDLETAASIMAEDTEFIFFKSQIGEENTFFFNIKLGSVSAPGSKLTIDILAEHNSWQHVEDIFLLSEKIVTVRITNADNFADAQGYITFRGRGVNIQPSDGVTIYEIWRLDPPFAGPKTQEVSDSDAAFDGNQSSFAIIADPWNLLNPQGVRNYLHFNTYIGAGIAHTFTFNILTNFIGTSDFLTIDVEDHSTSTPNDWKTIGSLSLDTSNSKTVTIENAQTYLDENGYISLRASWVTASLNPPSTNLHLYEIWRVDPFFAGPKTKTDPRWDYSPESAIDGNENTYARLFYFWSEYEHYEFLHYQAYLGDVSSMVLSIITSPSVPGFSSELVVEGENEPDIWSEIKRINLDSLKSTIINLENARQYVGPDGYFSMRIRWESDSDQLDAYIHEIRRESD